MLDRLGHKFSDALKFVQGKHKISETNIEEALGQIRTALLEADVNFKVVKDFIAQVKEKALGAKVISGVNPGEQFTKILHDELCRLLGGENQELKLENNPSTLLIVGLNGAGKTTFTAKIGLYLKEKKTKDIFIVPADAFRPAAKDQLLILCKQIGLDYHDSDLSLPPEQIVKNGLEEGKRLGKSVIIFDTAGRLHVDEELMGELKRVKAAVASTSPEILLVADAMTGQEAVNVAKTFHDALTLNGVVLSKMDSDARGGAALSMSFVSGVPIKFISMGEKPRDLELFHPDRLAKRILDMGDVVSLVEKAQEVVNEEEAQNMLKNLEKNRFTIEDFMKQMDTMNKLGSMQSILKMIPGMGGMLRQLGDLSPAENEMKKMKVMISSMTQAERRDDSLFKESTRLERVARGSGTQVSEVRAFLAKFAQMKKMMTGMFQMFKGGGMPAMPGMPGMPGMGGANGFRQAPGQSGKSAKKGKRKSPFARFRG